MATTVTDAAKLLFKLTLVENPEPWKNIYFADELLARCIGVNQELTEFFDIPTHIGSINGSVDRAGDLDKQYVRTTDRKSFDVIDPLYAEYRKTIPLRHKPRSCGGFNPFRRLQLISGKDYAMTSIVDVDTDLVVASIGDDTVDTISGNNGGSACGHPYWLSEQHFCMLDRFNDQIRTFSIDDNYNCLETQSLDIPTGSHMMHDEHRDETLTETQFYIAIEGSSSLNVLPQVIEATFDPNTGTFELGRTVELPGTTDTDSFHHYGASPDGTELWCPTYESGNVFVLNKASFSITDTIAIGAGGGHVNFSETLNVAVVTNHYDTFITIIDMSTMIPTNVTICGGTSIDGVFKQTHTPRITDDDLFFITGITHEGKLVRVDLVLKSIDKTIEIGGEPIQTYS